MGPDLSSLLALEDVHELVDDIQIDVHAGTVGEVGPGNDDDIPSGLHHPKTSGEDFRRGLRWGDVHPTRAIGEVGRGSLSDFQNFSVVARILSERDRPLESGEEFQQRVTARWSVLGGAKDAGDRIDLSGAIGLNFCKDDARPLRGCHAQLGHRWI